MTHPRSAIKFDLFADETCKRKIDALGDPLQIISRAAFGEELSRTKPARVRRAVSVKQEPAEVIVQEATHA